MNFWMRLNRTQTEYMGMSMGMMALMVYVIVSDRLLEPFVCVG